MPIAQIQVPILIFHYIKCCTRGQKCFHIGILNIFPLNLSKHQAYPEWAFCAHMLNPITLLSIFLPMLLCNILWEQLHCKLLLVLTQHLIESVRNYWCYYFLTTFFGNKRAPIHFVFWKICWIVQPIWNKLMIQLGFFHMLPAKHLPDFHTLTTKQKIYM